tara:strand:- start:137 stop:532 length:396 start_codon:yes stop_codon:yes gene_type:complete
MRITRIVEHIESNEIFVFGSNEAGRHGKGAAKTALKFGAKYNIARGLCGNTYAIPTKNDKIKTLSTQKIKKYVDEFITFAETHTNFGFLVTEIGCGLAGYTPEDIAPMFQRAIPLEHVHLPASFWKILNKK